MFSSELSLIYLYLFYRRGFQAGDAYSSIGRIIVSYKVFIIFSNLLSKYRLTSPMHWFALVVIYLRGCFVLG